MRSSGRSRVISARAQRTPEQRTNHLGDSWSVTSETTGSRSRFGGEQECRVKTRGRLPRFPSTREILPAATSKGLQDCGTGSRRFHRKYHINQFPAFGHFVVSSDSEERKVAGRLPATFKMIMLCSIDSIHLFANFDGNSRLS